MKVPATTRVIAPQAAIDTICDHCGGIFDLNDGAVNMFGKILCPECISVDVAGNIKTIKHDQPIMNDLHNGQPVSHQSVNR